MPTAEQAPLEAESRICGACVFEAGLERWIRSTGRHENCDACRADAPTRSANSIAKFVDERLHVEFDPALRWYSESEIADWIGATSPLFSTRELLASLGLESDDPNVQLARDAIVRLLPSQQWCRGYPNHPDVHEFASRAWRDFCVYVQHQRRFFFHSFDAISSASMYDPLPTDALSILERAVRRLGAIRRVTSGTKVFRARYVDAETALCPDELGAHASHRAGHPNRMSPPGIPMFYAADVEATAVAEVIGPAGEIVIAPFELVRDVWVVDFADLPDTPSLFDPDDFFLRSEAGIFRDFAREVSRPVRPDRIDHIEYIPTQIVTEYFVARVRANDGAPLDGMRYRSAKGDGVAYVFFYGREGLEGTTPEPSSAKPEFVPFDVPIRQERSPILRWLGECARRRVPADSP